MSQSRTLPAPLRPKWIVVSLSICSFMLLGSMATMSLSVGVVLIGAIGGFGDPKLFYKHFKAQFENKNVRRYLWATNLLTFACFLSLLFAVIWPLKIGPFKPEVLWVKDMWKAWHFYWPFVMIPTFNAISTDHKKIVVKSWLFSALAFVTLGFTELFTGWPVYYPSVIPGLHHVMAFTGSYLSYASIMSFPVLFTFNEVFEQKYISRKWSIPLTILGLITLVGTFSRTLWMALPIGIALLLLVRLPRRFAVPAVVSLVLLGGAVTQIPLVQKRLLASNGWSERMELWKINLEFFKERPLTGTGWHHNKKMVSAHYKVNFPEKKHPFVGHAHSNYIEWLGGLGLIGFVAGMYWCITVGTLALPVSLGIFVGWILFFLNGLTQVNFWEAKCIHSMTWAVTLSLVLEPVTRKALRKNRASIFHRA